MALQVHIDDHVEVFLGHVPDHPFAQQPGGIDDDVDLAVIIHHLLDHAARSGVIGDGVRIGLCRAAVRPDLSHDFLGRGLALILTTTAQPWIIDRDDGTFLGQQIRDFHADAAPGAGNDGCFSVQMHFELPGFYALFNSFRRSIFPNQTATAPYP